MSIQSNDITQLLPHAPPMRAIEAIAECTDDTLDARMTVRESMVAFDSTIGGVPSWMALEYFGQAAAAYCTLQLQGLGTRPRPGMLVSCRALTCHVPILPLGAVLSVVIERMSHAGAPLVRFAGRVMAGREVLAEADFSVYIEARGAFG